MVSARKAVDRRVAGLLLVAAGALRGCGNLCGLHKAPRLANSPAGSEYALTNYLQASSMAGAEAYYWPEEFDGPEAAIPGATTFAITVCGLAWVFFPPGDQHGCLRHYASVLGTTFGQRGGCR
jgi:hypothetical protein